MIPPGFEYYAPTSVNEATALLKQHGAEAKILSGGMSLIPLMKLRLAAPRHIIDINRIPELAYIKEADGFLKIGALTRESDLERSELIRSRYPILTDTASTIADPLVRNMATVAGILSTALNPDELLTEILIPIPPAGSGGAYIKMERKVGDFATAAVAAQLTIGAGGICERAGIGLTNAGPTPIKAEKAEGVLRGKKIDDEAIRQAAQLASEASDPKSDLRGSAEYKRDLVRVLTARVIRRALERVRNGR